MSVDCDVMSLWLGDYLVRMSLVIYLNPVSGCCWTSFLSLTIILKNKYLFIYILPEVNR